MTNGRDALRYVSMAYVKLDCGMLDSSIWVDREAREVFITALLMAVPHVVDEPTPTLKVGRLEVDEFVVPPGRYGFVAAASTGIIHRSGVGVEAGMAALERLASADPESRCPDFDGRRIVRVDGGFIVLGYARHRDRDETAAERQRRWRARQAEDVSRRDVTAPRRYITHVDVDVDVDVEKNPQPPTGEVERNAGKAKKPKPEFPPEPTDPKALQAYRDWREHKGKKFTPIVAKKVLGKLEAWGVGKFVAAVDHSIANGWAGLFEPPGGVVVNGKRWEHEAMWRERLRSDDPDLVALARKTLAEHGVVV